MLREARPEPSAELMRDIRGLVGEHRRARRPPTGRLALAAAVTAALIAPLGAFGALGYAQKSTIHAVKSVTHLVVAPAHKVSPARTITPTAVSPASDPPSSAGDQYKPGCGRGDKNHVHTGPPGRHSGFPGVCP
jgi:hypothetical protein